MERSRPAVRVLNVGTQSGRSEVERSRDNEHFRVAVAGVEPGMDQAASVAGDTPVPRATGQHKESVIKIIRIKSRW